MGEELFPKGLNQSLLWNIQSCKEFIDNKKPLTKAFCSLYLFKGLGAIYLTEHVHNSAKRKTIKDTLSLLLTKAYIYQNLKHYSTLRPITIPPQGFNYELINKNQDGIFFEFVFIYPPEGLKFNWTWISTTNELINSHNLI